MDITYCAVKGRDTDIIVDSVDPFHLKFILFRENFDQVHVDTFQFSAKVSEHSCE